MYAPSLPWKEGDGSVSYKEALFTGRVSDA